MNAMCARKEIVRDPLAAEAFRHFKRWRGAPLAVEGKAGGDARS